MFDKRKFTIPKLNLDNIVNRRPIFDPNTDIKIDFSAKEKV